MGNIRFFHFAAAYVFLVGFVFRIYWAFVGNSYSRQLFTLPFWRRSFWSELLHEVRWYAFLEKEPRKYIGHNPLAHLFMVVIITVGGLVMIVTGLALYSEQTGLGSWQDALFGWVIPFVGQSQDVRMWHHWGMWIIVVFVMLHVYTAIREDIMSRQSLISTMISGWRMFKDRPAVRCAPLAAGEGTQIDPHDPAASATSSGRTRASACGWSRRSPAAIRFGPNVRLLDGGTQGIYLVDHIRWADVLVVFDAIDYGLPPGTLRLIEGDEVPKFMGAKKMSLHQTGFQEVLALADLWATIPRHLLLIGVQPVELEDFGGSLRPEVKARIEPAIAAARSYLDGFGVVWGPGEGASVDHHRDMPHPALSLAHYESGRPSPEAACRIGDPRVLAMECAR